MVAGLLVHCGDKQSACQEGFLCQDGGVLRQVDKNDDRMAEGGSCFLPFQLKKKTECQCFLTGEGRTRQGEAQTPAAVPVAWLVEGAPEYAAVDAVVEPRATTENAQRTRRWTLRVALRFGTILAVPILTPLPNIAGHTKNTKLIGFLIIGV